MHLLRGGGGGGGGGGCVVHSGAAPPPLHLHTYDSQRVGPPTNRHITGTRPPGMEANHWRQRPTQDQPAPRYIPPLPPPPPPPKGREGQRTREKKKVFLCEDGESRASRANHGPGAASLLARRGARRLRLKMFARCFARRSNFFGSPTSLCRGAVPAGKAHAAIARLQHAAAAMATQAAVLRQGTAALRVIWPVGAAGGRRWLVSCRAACPLPQHEGNRGLFPPATATYGTAATATATAARPETASRRPASAWPGATSCA